jgi:transposase-like protein
MPEQTRFTRRGDEYFEAWERLHNYTAIAKEFGVDESTVRKSVKRRLEAQGADPAIARGMAAVGLETLPNGGWVKSTKPDDNGLLYSWYVSPQREAEAADKAATMADLMRSIPAVKLKTTSERADVGKLGFIPLNDLHAGAYAWAPETGYVDWDIALAVTRLQDWVGTLVARMPVCDEVVLFYNGDTLHTNGEDPFTPASKHVLDKDGRHFKVIDMTASAIITTADLAAQKHGVVRLVIKRGNHDEDSYLALLLAAKWRYAEQPNVIVEEDPSPYWLYTWGEVMLFGHHGDRVKPDQLVMKMAADHPEVWGSTKHRVVWTAHKHHREMKQMLGATWEQASCLTAPDAYGAAWGSHALAQAVIYHKERGEIERYTVRP